jgi:hypothetical protein
VGRLGPFCNLRQAQGAHLLVQPLQHAPGPPPAAQRLRPVGRQGPDLPPAPVPAPLGLGRGAPSRAPHPAPAHDHAPHPSPARDHAPTPAPAPPPALTPHHSPSPRTPPAAADPDLGRNLRVQAQIRGGEEGSTPAAPTAPLQHLRTAPARPSSPLQAPKAPPSPLTLMQVQIQPCMKVITHRPGVAPLPAAPHRALAPPLTSPLGPGGLHLMGPTSPSLSIGEGSGRKTRVRSTKDPATGGDNKGLPRKHYVTPPTPTLVLLQKGGRRRGGASGTGMAGWVHGRRGRRKVRRRGRGQVRGRRKDALRCWRCFVSSLPCDLDIHIP